VEIREIRFRGPAGWLSGMLAMPLGESIVPAAVLVGGFGSGGSRQQRLLPPLRDHLCAAELRSSATTSAAWAALEAAGSQPRWTIWPATHLPRLTSSATIHASILTMSRCSAIARVAG